MFITERSRWGTSVCPTCYYCNYIVRVAPQGGAAFRNYRQHLIRNHSLSFLWRNMLRTQGRLPIANFFRLAASDEDSENRDYWNILARVLDEEEWDRQLRFLAGPGR